MRVFFRKFFKNRIIFTRLHTNIALNTVVERRRALRAFVFLFGFRTDDTTISLALFKRYLQILGLSFNAPLYLKFRKYIYKHSFSLKRTNVAVGKALYELLSYQKYDCLNRYLLHLSFNNPSITSAVFSDDKTLALGFDSFKIVENAANLDKVITYGICGCSFFVGMVFHSNGPTLIAFHLDSHFLREQTYDRKILSVFDLFSSESEVEYRFIIAGYTFPTILFWLCNLISQLQLKNAKFSVFLCRKWHRDYLNVIYEPKTNRLYGVSIGEYEFMDWYKTGPAFISHELYEEYNMEDVTSLILKDLQKTY